MGLSPVEGHNLCHLEIIHFFFFFFKAYSSRDERIYIRYPDGKGNTSTGYLNVKSELKSRCMMILNSPKEPGIATKQPNSFKMYAVWNPIHNSQKVSFEASLSVR